MLQDSTHENIPIMIVGNKADLRHAVTEQGQKCVPVNYGEKLAMVMFKSTSLVYGYKNFSLKNMWETGKQNSFPELLFKSSN